MYFISEEALKMIGSNSKWLKLRQMVQLNLWVCLSILKSTSDIA